MAFSGVRAAPPTRRQLRHWEAVCRYLDAQPYRAVAYPFSSDGPAISVRLLKRIAHFRLVRHRDDCRWQLSPRWRAVLQRLWEEVADEDDAVPDSEPNLATPFVVDAGVDTLYANLLCEQDLPPALTAACDTYKSQAQSEDDTVETPWVVLGAPLSMFKAGKGTSGGGRGVSWSYILRNAMVMLVLRKTPLNQLIGSVRLSAEALWTLGPRQSLDRVRGDLRLMWGSVAPGSFKSVRWQLSQIHLCADIANFVPAADDLDRLLTRSLKKTLHLPAADAVEAAYLEGVADETMVLDETWVAEIQPPEWANVPETAFVGLDLFSSPYGEDENGAESTTQDDRDDGDWEWADEQGTAVHLYGRRVSGFAFSPGGDLSAAWYDKALQERQTGKRWMEPIHRAGGWDLSIPLFRIEARFRRGALREFIAAQTLAHDTESAEPTTGERWFDDPWICLAHLNDLWAYFAGLPPEADVAPDVTYRGWMRLALSDTTNANRTRWRTDPVWELVQRVRFTESIPQALIRTPMVRHDLEQVDAELYGLLKLRAALRGEYLDTTATLSQEVRAFVVRMDEVDAERGRDFAEEVREKARMLGKPLPMRESGLLSTRRQA